MFIQPNELKTVAYEYQLQQIVDNDNTIIATAIDAAIQEAESYLAVGYDCEKIFSAVGKKRNTLIVELIKDIALYKIVRLSNVDMLYENIEKRYDRTIKYLERVASGKLAPKLPLKTNTAGTPQTRFRFGSKRKFRH